MTPTVELSTSLGTGPKEELVFFRMDLRPFVLPPTTAELLLTSEEAAAVVTLDDISVATTSEVLLLLDTISEEVVVLTTEEDFVVTDWLVTSEELLATVADLLLLLVTSAATLTLLLPDTVTDLPLLEVTSDDFLPLATALLEEAFLDAVVPVDVCRFTSEFFRATLDFFLEGPDSGAGVMDTMTSLAAVPLF